MTYEVIDLYDYNKIDRGGTNGGYLTVYARTESAEMKKRIRPAMLIIPGGAYSMISDRGEPVAIQYLNNGYCAFTLSYSTHTKYPVPLIEAMLAVSFIRANAEKYNIDKNKMCALGFSAGGHLAGLLSTVQEDEAALIGKTVKEIKPDAAILSYPVVTMGEYTHGGTRSNITGKELALYDKLSVEKRVDKNAPPAFIWHTFEDNCVPVENSLMLASAYREAGVPFALHIFEHGGHGLSLSNDETCDFTEEQKNLYYIGKWFELSLDWLKARGMKTKVIN